MDGTEKVVETSVSTPETGDKPEVQIDWSKVDWSKVQIPETVVKSHPEYQKVLSESVERRQTIKTMKEQLAKSETGTSTETTQQPATQPASDLEKKFADEIANLRAEIRKTEVAQARAQALKDIPEEFQGFVTGDTVEAINASAANVKTALGKRPAPPPTTSTGLPGIAGNTDAEKANSIVASIFGEGNANPFDPGQQIRAGGGGIQK